MSAASSSNAVPEGGSAQGNSQAGGAGRPAAQAIRLLADRPGYAPPPQPVIQPLPRHSPAVGGLVPFSTVDWPGQLAAVVFISGCPWRCHYCHNTELQTRAARYDWREVRGFLETRKGLLDAVVFSGGEPLSEPRLPAMIRDVRRMGYRVGLHTAGIYPLRLADVLRHLDWVGMDIKADAKGYDDITGRRDSQRPALACLTQLLSAGLDFECRITWHPDWLDEARLMALARELARRGVRRFAVQAARAAPGAPVARALSNQAQAELRQAFQEFAYR
ncbi:MAG: anaerobic ribonucleoside-triphosphate reductase activating protein [Achromobacter sp.]|uniref:anaerobic ribonucleoside-triphosphate reductase activating protein n=1 Tax=unclassified Achromobacter TaxID=2626865 RepID=UPI0006F618C3|nr:anaerobic ribonucleoside-triphosphate reductase activating protein [Achromobacter sp. Root565]KRA01983.1 anaerobic ribonucleoside-triphosphate reductase activating protein [Achromobacter sp. Root565]